MVIKGRARGGPVALAKHLERHDTNEKVSLRELRGVTARDVEGALREMDCMGAGAISTRTLYHAAINTAPKERLTDDQKQQAIERLGQELGLSGQPRIVVEHLKKGREHIHVVFLRIDTDRMIAIRDSHNYRRHEIVARDLERQFGHKRVQGAHVGREDQERPERTPSHAEMQQAERSGLSPQAAKEQVTHLWTQADSGTAFAAALKDKGWVLARGDKRDFVVIDPAGEPHSLARRIEGAKAADVRQRLSGIDSSTLPSVAEAKTSQRTLVTAVPDRTSEKTGIALPVLKTESVSVKRTAPRKPRDRPIHTKTERITDVAKTTLRKQGTSPQHIRETLKLNKTPPTKLQQLYVAAARATAHVIGTARKLLKRKPDLPLPQKPRPEPVEKTIKLDRITVRRTLNQPVKVAKKQPSAPKPARQRMTPAELDAMLSRQQARRQNRGPSI